MLIACMQVLTTAPPLHAGVYYYVMLTSALSSTIGSMSLKVVLIFVSAVQDQVGDPISWAGIALATGATAVYAWLSFVAQQQEAAAMPPPRMAQSMEGGAAVGSGSKGHLDTETTPLKGSTSPSSVR